MIVLSRYCATGKGASSPVHAAVAAPRSDWTALSETSSAAHPCRHDNMPISQQGCACEYVGGGPMWDEIFSCFASELIFFFLFYVIAKCFSLKMSNLTALANMLSGTFLIGQALLLRGVCVTSCPIRDS